MACCGENWLVPGADPGGGGGGGGGVNSVLAGTNVTITGTPTDPIVNASGSVPRPSATIYVSPSGDDLTADGSISKPFQTIQAAIIFRNGLSNTANIEIFIFAGNYVENLTITVPNTYFTCNPAPYLSVKTVLITGTVTVSINVLTGQGSGEVAFTNIGWLSTSITTGSTVAQGLQMSFYNCSILGWALHNQDSPTNYTVRYFDCFLQHTGTEGLITSVGCIVQVMRCELIHTNSVTNPLINIQNGGGGGSGSLNLQYSYLKSTTTSATAQPIIRYQNTATSNSGNIFNHNSMIYPSSVADTGSNKCCIQFNQTGTVIVESLLGNQLINPGASYGNAPNYKFCIQRRNSGTVTIIYVGVNGGVFQTGTNVLTYVIDNTITVNYKAGIVALFP